MHILRAQGFVQTDEVKANVKVRENVGILSSTLGQIYKLQLSKKLLDEEMCLQVIDRSTL